MISRCIIAVIALAVGAHAGCAKDYSSQCPEGWTAAGANSCQADNFYRGPCDNVEVVPHSESGKMRFAALCEENWPCVNAASQDFSQPCPASWTHTGAGQCEATASYTGRCVRSYNFRDHSAALRRRWSSMCDAPWPTAGFASKSFLSTRVSPVGNGVKNSLHATEPMRNSPMAVNVFVKSA